jgi:flavorubredoxin
MRFLLLFLLSSSLFAVEYNPNALINVGILYGHYNTVVAVSKIIGAEISGIENKLGTLAIVSSEINKIVTDIRNSSALVAGVSEDDIKALNRRYVGLSAALVSINAVLKKSNMELGDRENREWISNLKSMEEIVIK